MTRRLAPSVPLPADTDVLRFGNVLLSFWSPPDRSADANAAFGSVLRAWLSGASAILVLDHRPGRLAGLPPDVLAPGLATLFRSFAPTAPGSPFSRLASATALAHVDRLAPGVFPLRQRSLDEHGITRIRSIQGGHLLLHSTATALSDGLGRIEIAPTTRFEVTVVTNPYARYAQHAAKALRALIAEDPTRLTVTWLGTGRSFCVLGSDASLHDLLGRIEHMTRPSVPD